MSAALGSDSENVSDLIAYLRLLRTTECSVHHKGSTAPSVLAGQKGDMNMKVDKLMIKSVHFDHVHS